MTTHELCSEELTEAERAVFDAYVVPAASPGIEEQLMSRWQASLSPHSALPIRKIVMAGALLAVAAALIVSVKFERHRPGNAVVRSATSQENPRLRKPASSRPTKAQPQSGWRMTGPAFEFYEHGVDAAQLRNGHATQFLGSTEAHMGFASWTTTIGAEKFRGKRLRLSGWVKTGAIERWSGLWMRVDVGQVSAAFDNMKDRPILGDSDWRRYEIVLAVPANATSISYGLLLSGRGSVWGDEMQLDVVDDDVPITKTATSGDWFEGDTWEDAFEVGLDESVLRGGTATRFLRSRGSANDRVGTWMKREAAETYRGQRVRFSADVRSDAVDSWAGLWMRVDVRDRNRERSEMVAFDNMGDRPIRGNAPWQRYEVVLDVSLDATGIVYGALLNGDGTVWMSNPVFEVVSTEVSVTK